MASVGAFLNLQRPRQQSGATLADLLEISPALAVNILAQAAEERRAQDAAGPNLRPANPMQEILEQERLGAANALQRIPFSPLAAAVELASPAAYDAMTAPVEGANPEVPNMIAGLDMMALGGLVDTPMAAGLLRARGLEGERAMAAAAPSSRRATLIDVVQQARAGRRGPSQEAPAETVRGATLGDLIQGAAEPGTGNLLPEGGVTVPEQQAGASLGGLLSSEPPAQPLSRPKQPRQGNAGISEGQFVQPEEVPLNLNRYLAVYGDPGAKVRKRGGQPIEYAVAPKAEGAVRLEREGKPYYIGKLTPEQWLEKQQAWVGPKDSTEWNEARDWYSNLLSQFTQVYGEEKAPTMLVAWALSQQRASPSAGMGHVLKAQDIVGGWRTAEEGLAGLAHDRLIEALTSGRPEVGEKLADFVDASRGKTTRQWVGDDPRGGQPAPFDVHASRDVGFIDDTTLSTIAKTFGPDVAKQFAVDMKGAPSDGQYAYGSKFYNNLKDVLNANLQPGEKPYTAAEVQAIGWVGHQKMTGVAPEGPTAIFRAEAGGRSTSNISRVAVEAAPGDGAPRRALWEQIPEPRRAEATYQSLRSVAPDVAKFSGVALANQDASLGVWEQFKNPNVVFEVVGTPEGALRFAKAMGYVGQQSEAWAQRSSIRTRANAFGLDIIAPEGYDMSSPKDVERFWKESGLETVPGLGATPLRGRDGKHRLRLIFERDLSTLSKAAVEDGRDFDTLAERALKAIEASPVSGIQYEQRPLTLHKAVHDWKGDQNGEGHLVGLGGRARGELDGLSRRVEESLRSFLGQDPGTQAGTEGRQPFAGQSPEASGVTLGALAGLAGPPPPRAPSLAGGLQ